MDISFTVCLFVSTVCTVMDFFAADKARGVKICTSVYRRLRKGISHFGEHCSPRSPELDESASVRAMPTGM